MTSGRAGAVAGSNGGPGAGGALSAPVQAGHPGAGVAAPGALRARRVPAARARPHPQFQGTAVPEPPPPALTALTSLGLCPGREGSPGSPQCPLPASQPSQETKQNHLVGYRTPERFWLEGIGELSSPPMSRDTFNSPGFDSSPCPTWPGTLPGVNRTFNSPSMKNLQKSSSLEGER